MNYFVLVPVHPSQGTDVGKDVLQCVGELEGIHVTQAELDVGIDHELGET